MKCFGHFMHKAPEFSATGLSPCCLPGSGGSFGGGAHVNVNFTTGAQQLRHLPQLQCELWSLGSSVLVTVASGVCWETAVLEPCKPHLLRGTDPAIKCV